MKKGIGILLAACFVLLSGGCSGEPAAASSGQPSRAQASSAEIVSQPDAADVSSEETSSEGEQAAVPLVEPGVITDFGENPMAEEEIFTPGSFRVEVLPEDGYYTLKIAVKNLKSYCPSKENSSVRGPYIPVVFCAPEGADASQATLCRSDVPEGALNAAGGDSIAGNGVKQFLRKEMADKYPYFIIDWDGDGEKFEPQVFKMDFSGTEYFCLPPAKYASTISWDAEAAAGDGAVTSYDEAAKTLYIDGELKRNERGYRVTVIVNGSPSLEQGTDATADGFSVFQPSFYMEQTYYMGTPSNQMRWGTDLNPDLIGAPMRIVVSWDGKTQEEFFIFVKDTVKLVE